MQTALAQSDGDLTLWEYWVKHRALISDMRHWDKGANDDTSKAAGKKGAKASTMRTYHHYMVLITHNLLPGKPMSELSAFELLDAVSRTRKANGKPCKESTLKTRISLLNDIYNYAEDRGDACNDLQWVSKRETNYFFRELMLPAKERQEAFQELLKKNRKKLRSLTAAQQRRLVDLIVKHIETDGRYLALAILLYTGMRPSECRGLIWADFVPFRDHPDRHMLSVTRQGGKKRWELVDRLKRPSSYRKIGVHFELEEIIRRRLDFVRGHIASKKGLDHLHMCCFENEFDQGCTHSQLATFVVSILRNSIKVTGDVFFTCAMDMYAYEDTDPLGNPEDCQVCTYLLRHNFWTWLQSGTELTAEEKRYYMGHAIYDGHTDKRLEFNHEDRLWDILLKQDHLVKSPTLHESAHHTTISAHGSSSIPNTGFQVLHVPRELLRTGGTLTILARAHDVDCPIVIKTLSPTKNVYKGDSKLQVHLAAMPHTREGMYRGATNCDYDNWRDAKRGDWGVDLPSAT